VSLKTETILFCVHWLHTRLHPHSARRLHKLHGVFCIPVSAILTTHVAT